ncbi:MAG: hypothetical protein JW888_05545, partial [Pirellulales bacterium]|nr:hypothetical protein [Pirellulales bacterium]
MVWTVFIAEMPCLRAPASETIKGVAAMDRLGVISRLLAVIIFGLSWGIALPCSGETPSSRPNILW